MKKVSIFLGFKVNPLFEKAVKSKTLFDAFTMGGAYLQQMHDGPDLLLGKLLTTPPSLNELELMEQHIYSLLKRLAPNYPLSDHCLVLVPYSHGNTRDADC